MTETFITHITHESVELSYARNNNKKIGDKTMKQDKRPIYMTISSLN